MTRTTRIRTLTPALVLLAVASVAVPAALPGADVTQSRAAMSDDPVASAAGATIVSRPCFGAASRNPLFRCVDPSLRRTVFPAPDDAVLLPNAPCEPEAEGNLVDPCTFGATRSSTRPSVALIGDSHATHWRAAVDVVARTAGLRAVSITRSGCPFSSAQVVIPTHEQAAKCRRWNREVVAWLGNHPEVSTVFVSQRANAHYLPAGRGVSNFDTAVRGYGALWRSLPQTVKSVIVIRDTPLDSAVAAECVRRGYARKQAVDTRCARSRAVALPRDPATTAARRLRGRVHVLDMTPFFCSPERCYPVVGGALVHKDADHITSVFARTLGPFMVRKVADIVRSAPAAAAAAAGAGG